MSDRLSLSVPRLALSYAAWPGLLIISLSIAAYGFATDRPIVFFSIAYALQALLLYALEQAMPHEEAWNENDGQTAANLGHTLLSKGTVQSFAAFGSLIGVQAYFVVAGAGSGIWPTAWPLWAQVLLGLAAAELGLYWIHRLSHHWPPLWRFHAIHHSVTRLWIVNTGRFHFIDSLLKVGAALALLWFSGAPAAVTIWVSAVTAFVGLLTHCNVEMRFGPLSLLFNTPELHRWHHSRDPREGNMNYGENLVIWDQLFGTYINPRRRPPADIGIGEAMPPGFLQQLAWPFQRRR